MSYGELTLPAVFTGVNRKTGRFLKGHVPANKGKKWDEFMSKRAQRRSSKGWRNLDLYRNKNGRSDCAGRCRKSVVAVMGDGRWLVFGYVGAAAEWLRQCHPTANRENISRCCRQNTAGGRNTDHGYYGVRFYFESDNVWTTKI